jgi:ABC-type hemin transport system ATPase subunit
MSQEQHHTTETRPVLETNHLSHIVSGKRLVDDITVRVQKGEVLAVA